MSATDDEKVQFKLRVSQSLKQRIETAAAASGRSVNQETIGLLEETLDQSDGLGSSGKSLLRQLAEVLAAAAKAAGPAWIENRTAWELVRSTIDRLLADWEPWDEDNELSDAAAQAYEKWRASTAIEGRTRDQIEAEFKELELRHDVIGLSADERARFDRLRTALNGSPDLERLDSNDRANVKRKISDDRIRSEFWRAVAPIFAGPPGRDKYQPKRRKW